MRLLLCEHPALPLYPGERVRRPRRRRARAHGGPRRDGRRRRDCREAVSVPPVRACGGRPQEHRAEGARPQA
eukprot:1166915-Prymnesium_polylepis.1